MQEDGRSMGVNRGSRRWSADTAAELNSGRADAATAECIALMQPRCRGRLVPAGLSGAGFPAMTIKVVLFYNKIRLIF